MRFIVCKRAIVWHAVAEGPRVNPPYRETRIRSNRRRNPYSTSVDVNGRAVTEASATNYLEGRGIVDAVSSHHHDLSDALKKHTTNEIFFETCKKGATRLSSPPEPAVRKLHGVHVA